MKLKICRLPLWGFFSSDVITFALTKTIVSVEKIHSFVLIECLPCTRRSGSFFSKFVRKKIDEFYCCAFISYHLNINERKTTKLLIISLTATRAIIFYLKTKILTNLFGLATENSVKSCKKLTFFT